MREALRNSLIALSVTYHLRHCGVCRIRRAFWFAWQTASFCSYHALAYFQELHSPRALREHPAKTEPVRGSPVHALSFMHKPAWLRSFLTLAGPGANAQVLQYVPLCHAEGRVGRCEISFWDCLSVQALSERGDLWETLKTVKGRKSLGWCHLIMKTHFSSSFAATWMGRLFHLKKISFREGELTVVFERRVLPHQLLQTDSTIELFTDL